MGHDFWLGLNNNVTIDLFGMTVFLEIKIGYLNMDDLFSSNLEYKFLVLAFRNIIFATLL